MPLDKRQAFKLGFLTRLADEGMSPAQIEETVKSAAISDFVTKPWNVAWDIGGSTAKTVGGGLANMGMLGAIAGPPLLGALAGYGAARMTDIGDEDVEELRQQELINEYRRLADRARQNKMVKDYRTQRKTTGRYFG